MLYLLVDGLVHTHGAIICRDGTTDVTRTMHFGTPSAYEKVP